MHEARKKEYYTVGFYYKSPKYRAVYAAEECLEMKFDFSEEPFHSQFDYIFDDSSKPVIEIDEPEDEDDVFEEA